MKYTKEFFLEHTVLLANGCRVWWNRTDKLDRYKQLGDPPVLGHRIVYALYYGPPKYTVHHNCETKGCLEYTHLEDMTNSDHAKLHRTAQPNAPKSAYCIRGHERTPENVTGNGNCLACKKLRYRTFNKDAVLKRRC
jgi:hypothetical protein